MPGIDNPAQGQTADVPADCGAGSFIWYELMTDDAPASAAFYQKVVGWKVSPPAPGDPLGYRMIERDDGAMAGGILPLSPEMTQGGARPAWLGYIAVADVDASYAAITGDGGEGHMPPSDIEGVGRIALVTDPWGAPFYIMTPQPPEGAGQAASSAFTVDRPQSVRWNELVTPDRTGAIAFYLHHFGWSQEGAMPMGDLGDYCFIQRDAITIGAVMAKPDFMTHCGWSFYIGVDDIDRAVAAAREGGAHMHGDPQPIPGGEFSVAGSDPQGAAFALVGPRRE
ncbi:VOC family protein [Novosphingobium sp. YJ-S2-02]|uniref:VOC family protein n=1 Tax=Novosphingobium aureum TaxID=2792964 RepID=A0A931HCN8_9SPHN|nr:VOC family protein [Novosphingobium aureum]MBH0113610.1 VOC family protein [Novosphingobium aureum]